MTAVAYEGYEAKAIEAAIKLIKDSTTFRALLGTGHDPCDFIVEISGGVEAETTPKLYSYNNAQIDRATYTVYAHVCPDPFEMSRQWVAPQTIPNAGTIPIALYFRTDATLKEHERLRYALSKTGLICQDMQNQQGQSGKWRRIIATITNLSFADQTGFNRGIIRSQISLQYGDLP